MPSIKPNIKKGQYQSKSKIDNSPGIKSTSTKYEEEPQIEPLDLSFTSKKVNNDKQPIANSQKAPVTTSSAVSSQIAKPFDSTKLSLLPNSDLTFVSSTTVLSPQISPLCTEPKVQSTSKGLSKVNVKTTVHKDVTFNTSKGETSMHQRRHPGPRVYKNCK